MTRKAKKNKKKKSRLRILIICITIIGLLICLGASVYKDFIQIANNRKEIEKLDKEYQELVENKDALESEVTKMQDPDYIARYAKEKYLYSSSGEIILRGDE